MIVRRKLVAGNWKLHNTIAESVALAKDLKGKLSRARDVEVAIAPVSLSIAAVAHALEGSNIHVAGQDVHWEDRGAFTGEVSAPLLRDAGCSMCIVGHSERRQYFGENDAAVSKKTRALLGHGLIPIVCVGEMLDEREAGQTLSTVLGQIEGGFEGLSVSDAAKVVVAYEPVWAIGTGRTASPNDAQEVHAAIRGWVAERFNTAVAQGMRILYGGSVKPDNAAELMSQPDVDGALVGGASLEARSFVPIVEAAE